MLPPQESQLLPPEVSSFQVLQIEYFSEMEPLFRFIMLGLAWNEAGTPLARSYCEAKIPIFEKADEVCYRLLTLELYQ